VVAQLKRRVAELNSELEVREAEVASMKDMTARVAASQASEEAEATLRKSEVQCQSVRKETARLDAHVKELNIEAAQLEANVKSQSQTNAAINSQIIEKRIELRELEQRVDILTRSAHDLSIKIDARRKEADSAQATTPAKYSAGNNASEVLRATPSPQDLRTPGGTHYDQNSDRAGAPMMVQDLGNGSSPGTEALSPIERRKSRLLALRKRLQDQYGAAPAEAGQAPQVQDTAASATHPLSPSPGKDGEKSFDDLVNVCIRLREELDEQRSALLAEFSSPQPIT